MSPSNAFDLNFLVSQYNTPSTHATVTGPQIEHRIHIVRDIWAIPEGARVLEIGPGQGDCTLVLAAAVGDTGHVDAVDPCDLDYGIV
jgi:predicted methyltransferase